MLVVVQILYGGSCTVTTAVVSCCSGGDGRDVEQAGQSVSCSSVDHHPGYSGWAAVTLPAHISTVQGSDLMNTAANTITTENNWHAV